MPRPFRLLLASVMVAGTVSCAEVPQEAVTLATTVQSDLETISQAHLALAQDFFDARRSRANQLVDQAYQPLLARKVAEATLAEIKKVDADIAAKAAEIKTIDPTTSDGARQLIKTQQEIQDLRDRQFNFMQIAVEKTTAAVAAQRQKLMASIQADEQKVVAAITDAYNRVRGGQATVVAYLNSVRGIQVQQEQVLSDLGLDGLRQRFIDTSATLSDEVNKVVGDVQSGQAKIDEVTATIEKLAKEWSGK